MKLYCLSGLGVDERAFRYLHPEGVEFSHIQWIPPQKKESLPAYAKRLFDENIKEEKYNLLGLSFGGMLAREFAKIRMPEKLFLLSTISTREELPWFLKVAGATKLYNILPAPVLQLPNFITRYLFSVHQEKTKALFKEILADTDPHFLRWAMDAILKWHNRDNIKGIVIHGEQDMLLPLKWKADYIIKGGGHMMVVDHADEISSIIASELIKREFD